MERSVSSPHALFFRKTGKVSRDSSNLTDGYQDIRLSLTRNEFRAQSLRNPLIPSY